MEILCVEDSLDTAIVSCICQYPLLSFCAAHQAKHFLSAGFHFMLPISTLASIKTKQEYLLAKQRIIQLYSQIEALQEQVQDLRRCEEQIGAAVQEIISHVLETEKELKHQLSIAVDEFQALITHAVSEANLHALDAEEYTSDNSLAQLLLHSDLEDLALKKLYIFEAICINPNLGSALQVGLSFNVPELEHVRIDSVNGVFSEQMNVLTKPKDEISRKYFALKEKHKNLKTGVKEVAKNLQGTKYAQILNKVIVKDGHSQSLGKPKQQESIDSAEKVNKSVKGQIEDVNKMNEKPERQLTAAIQEIAISKKRFEDLEIQHKDVLTENKHLSESLDGTKKILDQIMSQYGKFTQQKEIPASAIIAVLPNEIKTFNMTSNQWQSQFALNKSIRVNAGSSSTLIAGNEIFVCGGGSTSLACISHIDATAYVLQVDGFVVQVQNMWSSRYTHGVVYCHEINAVYVFGGANSEVLKCCEKFIITDSTWETLPDMHEARACFNPCIHSFLVYLCGGNTTAVETYDLIANSFTVLPFTLPEDTYCTTLVESECVVVVSFQYICKWDVVHRRVILSLEHQRYPSWSSCTPVVHEERIYIVNLYKRVCSIIGLADGVLKLEFSLA